MIVYWQLFYEFFQIGLFAIGGGMATIPFLEHLSETTGWYSAAFISDMIAISESTPGPIGINMATYVGYNVGGLPGGIIATLGEIIPSIIIVVLVSKSLEKFSGNHFVEDAFFGLRPAVTALIMVAGLTVMQSSFLHLESLNQLAHLATYVDWGKLVFFVLVFYCIKKFHKHPVFYIAVSAVIGIVFQF